MIEQENLIKFSMVDCKIEIDNRYDYVNAVMEELENKGLISEIMEQEDIYWYFGDATQLCKMSEDGMFIFDFKYILKSSDPVVENFEYIFSIVFSFETYSSCQQLYVEIQSNNYDLNIKNKTSYLEVFKNILRKILLKSWNKCIWLYDIESEKFSAYLYTRVYETENLFRQLINNVMSKVFGANWWVKLAPHDLKKKRKVRISSYKEIAPTFTNVDETLMTIDVGDLLTITQLKKKKWHPMDNEEINNMVNDLCPFNQQRIIEILKKQSKVEVDIWTEYFSKLLSLDFIDNFNRFEKNRNHIAHNKLIDRQAYESILQNIECVNEDIREGLIKFNDQYISEERKELIEFQKEIEFYEQKALYEEIMESDAGIEIRNDSEIYGMYDDALFEMFNDITDYFMFRDDIEITDFDRLIYEPEEQKLFEIVYTINNRTAFISCSFDIDTSQGARSQMRLVLTLDGDVKEYYIPYINGEAVYNDDQGYYMPEVQDEFGYWVLESAKEDIVDYINENFENLREKIDSEMYKIIKDGGSSPVADIPCFECGEEYVCIDDRYAELGTCLNCGAKNDIIKCEICGLYFEGKDSEYEDDEPRICGNCDKRIRGE